jgi:hypothetical protein
MIFIQAIIEIVLALGLFFGIIYILDKWENL